MSALHRCTLPGLCRLDPQLRIRPRLHHLTSQDIAEALHALGRLPTKGNALLHGDMHLGQMIDASDGTVWLIDLDDLCLGPAEADLGNLIANLATQAQLGDSFAKRLAFWRREVEAAWAKLVEPVCPDILERYIALALIRRHLKFREAGRPDYEAEIVAWINPVAARISPSGSAGYPG
ncbi:phosphotransferase [Palleronia caenipelagi]|uniref:phosphotransferase n=1 Tax=Palleronia caenipelagi TaxID=2489174 RepID=UPI001C8F44A5|nr:phosphotransferase [Palleronia caenipelagi]